MLIAPPWLRSLSYPGWTNDRDTSTGVAARTPPNQFTLQLAAKKRWFTWPFATKSGGGLTASG